MLTTRLKRDVIFLAFISSNFILLHHLPALSKPCGADVLQDGTAILVHAGCTEEPPHNTQEGQGMHDRLIVHRREMRAMDVQTKGAQAIHQSE